MPVYLFNPSIAIRPHVGTSRLAGRKRDGRGSPYERLNSGSISADLFRENNTRSSLSKKLLVQISYLATIRATKLQKKWILNWRQQDCESDRLREGKKDYCDRFWSWTFCEYAEQENHKKIERLLSFFLYIKTSDNEGKMEIIALLSLLK
jgi:hypothetical protein